MRKGSTSLGSLGVISPGISLLILPACLSAALLLAVSSSAAGSTRTSRTRDAQLRTALARRATILQREDGGSRGSIKPVRVFNTRATWYGPGFHGRRTASGEVFNQNALTLASRHLPLGTRVRVVNSRTGKSAIARVNDRGPFGARGYSADLSRGLARKIGLGGSGPVRLEVLPKQ